MKRIIIISTILTLTFLSCISLLKKKHGKIIILNGMSSTGKSTIAKHLIQLLDPSYEKICLDDFIAPLFLRQKTRKLPQNQFLRKIKEQTHAMHHVMQKKITNGKNVVLDTLLSGLEGQKDTTCNLEALKKHNVILVLIHCRLPKIIKRIKKRNKKAAAEHKPENMRPMHVALKIDHVYAPTKKNDKNSVETLSQKDIKKVYKTVKKEPNKNITIYKNIKYNLLSYFGLTHKKKTAITPHLDYDLIIDTNKTNAKKCAQKIADFVQKTPHK